MARQRVKIYTMPLDRSQNISVENAVAFAVENLMPIEENSQMYIGFNNGAFDVVPNGTSRPFNAPNVLYNETLHIRFTQQDQNGNEVTKPLGACLVTITQLIDQETV